MIPGADGAGDRFYAIMGVIQLLHRLNGYYHVLLHTILTFYACLELFLQLFV